MKIKGINIDNLILWIEELKSVEKFGKLDMGEPFVKYIKAHECGTPACHGGWALLLLGFDENLGNKNKSFYAGMDALTEFIMSELNNLNLSLKVWAMNNPELWGNGKGHKLFYSEEAFGIKYLKKKLTLKDIRKHWQGVLERLLESEED